MKKLYMMVGLPGCGKSTWIDNEFQNEDVWRNSTRISTDDVIMEVCDVFGLNYHEYFKELIDFASKVSMETLKTTIDINQNIYWDQTNLGVKARARKLALIPVKDFHKVAVVFDVNDAVLKERLKNRGEKQVDWSIVEDMKKRFVIPTKDEGFDEIIHVKGIL